MTTITIDTPVSPATARALGSEQARATLSTLARRLDRRRLPRPGGAAREFRVEIPLEGGERVEIILPTMGNGGRILVVHRLENASLHGGRILRVPRAILPDTLMIALAGRRLGDVVDLSGTSISEIASARITDVFDTDHDGQALLFHTDAPTILPTFEAKVTMPAKGRRTKT